MRGPEISEPRAGMWVRSYSGGRVSGVFKYRGKGLGVGVQGACQCDCLGVLVFFQILPSAFW